MEESLLYLVINSILYFFLLVYCVRMTSYISGSSLISFFYLVSSVFSILFYTNPYTKQTEYYSSLSVIPLFYFFCLTIISLYPIIRFERNKIDCVRLVKEKHIFKYILIVLPIQLFLYVSFYPTFLSTFSSDMSIMRDSIASGDVSVLENVHPLVGKLMFYYSL